ncbi:MAG: MBL fold metallo-hydrolase [Elusimicrobia bacterium CG08_land_8_20_14_0_20_59_10]|nr:MAG: MBL fold metallo-hydrolase [Elusimicrobia bacterium CG08_land_8_20_14_0_20_59_10]
MDIIFLGTNGWYDTKIAHTLCILIKTRKYDIVLDAGSGFSKLDKYVDGTKPVYLFLSHFHLDHVAGLHTLLKFDLKKGLKLCGGEGARGTLGALLRRPFTVPLKNLRYKAEVLELPSQLGKIPFECACLPLQHADPVLGYRFELEGKIIVFCTDTGYCKNSVKLADKADLLLAECSFLPGEENPGWPHMNPQKVSALAREAGAKKLVLIHFDAARYPKLSDRTRAAAIARKTFKNTFAANDGLRIKL